MSDTIGDMIDKLTIANIRIWHIEDEKRQGSGDNLIELIKKTSDVNIERNKLIDQINAGLAVLVDHKNGRDSIFALTSDELLGTGKNKFYQPQVVENKYSVDEINQELSAGSVSSKYYGQWETDRIIETYFKDKVSHGVCIDVGAADGVRGSNTKYFENNGWYALCIEPNPDHAESLKNTRQHSIICACGESAGNQKLIVYNIGKNNISTSVTSLRPDMRLVNDHIHILNTVHTEKVQVLTLNEIIEYNVPKGDIDFISIDTEGTELDVLKGLDLNKHNVKLLVVENNYNDPEIEEYLKKFNYVKDQRYHINDFYVKDSTKVPLI